MITIITGDIINSRKSSNQKWLSELKLVLSFFGTSPKYWQVYRGDSFQLEIENCESALNTVLRIKSHLKSTANVDVRLSIGIGEKEFNVDRITESNGEAFVNSGFAFDNYLKKQNLAIKTPWKEIDEELNIAFNLALLTIDSWTKNSAEVFKISLEKQDVTQKEIGAILGITQGRVSERQKRAGLEPIMKLEKRFRKIINKKINE
ncbi:sigma factor-like helix-turn-helix DNA-binding protein [Polaribacter sp. SA4-12]|uniref:sigma factor-like helix-turn-helix DNA-binding protein n=1 Tax=Polaribacter sp. SA4-12 TaxID=1312072 RepID=UPI000B3D0144|nr:sigma factor-like helix-turn-helix DNA-binding protein [Polaribacter sp. SA4-12]ARV14352.1 transcriptional regulator [Polaribacter sp. SA4-12]